MIYHIGYATDWQNAQSGGEYRISTRGRTLEQQGFIHAGEAHQVAPVANAIYKGDTDVIVLVIDPDLVHAEIRYDQVPGWNDPFPHIYGPLNTDAVVGTIPLSQDEAGQFVFTAE